MTTLRRCAGAANAQRPMPILRSSKASTTFRDLGSEASTGVFTRRSSTVASLSTSSASLSSLSLSSHQRCRCYGRSSAVHLTAPPAPSFLRRTFATSTASTGGGGILSGLKDRLSTKMEERKMAAADDKFGAMVRDMLQSTRWTLEQQRALMRDAAADAGVSGWKSWMPGVSSQAGVEQLKKTLTLLDAFTAEERRDVELIDRVARTRVAAEAKATVADVNYALKQFSGAVMVHRWLRDRREKGKPMPTSQAEMTRMMVTDKPAADPALKHRPRRR